MLTSGAGTSPERLERLLAAMIDGLTDLRPLAVSFAEAFPQAIRSTEPRTGLAATYQQMRTASADLIAGSVEADGATISREHAITLSALVIAVCDGHILQWLLDPEAVPSSNDVMAALGAVTVMGTSS